MFLWYYLCILYLKLYLLIYDIVLVFNEVMVNNIIVGNFEKLIIYKGKFFMFFIF